MNFQEIKQTFQSHGQWQAKYRELMLLGKHLPKHDAAFYDDAHLVKGCESKVWLKCEIKDGAVQLCLDSDTRIVKGLCAVLISLYNGVKVSEAKLIAPEQAFEELGLMRHMSQSRGNGIRAMCEQIKTHLVEHA